MNTMLSAAAQEGARVGAVTPDFSRIQQAIEEQLIGVRSEDVTISIQRTELFTEIGITYTFVPVTPMISSFIGPDGLTLERAARMQLLGVFP